MSALASSIEQVINDVVEPLVHADGGELFVLNWSDHEVVLHLRGQFSGCPGNTLAIRRVIEPAILAVAPQANLVISSGELVPEAASPWAARSR